MDANDPVEQAATVEAGIGALIGSNRPSQSTRRACVLQPETQEAQENRKPRRDRNVFARRSPVVAQDVLARPRLARHPRADEPLTGLSVQAVPAALVPVDEGTARELARSPADGPAEPHA